eukprot:5809978-Prymnesium_polylepis.1
MPLDGAGCLLICSVEEQELLLPPFDRKVAECDENTLAERCVERPAPPHYHPNYRVVGWVDCAGHRCHRGGGSTHHFGLRGRVG